MSITNYTQNFLNFLSNHKAETEEIGTIFDPVSENKMGKYLRFAADDDKVTILNFNHDIRDMVQEEKPNGRKCLADLLYKGNDFARNVLIDNGFFVIDEDKYHSLKSGWRYFKLRGYDTFTYKNGFTEYFYKPETISTLENIKNFPYSTNDIKSKCDYYLQKIKVSKDDDGDYTAHSYKFDYESHANLIHTPKHREYSLLAKIKNIFGEDSDDPGFIIMLILGAPLILALVFGLIIENSNIDSRIVFGGFFLLVVLIVLYVSSKKASAKKFNENENQKYIKTRDFVDNALRNCALNSRKAIQEKETYIRDRMKKGAEQNKLVTITGGFKEGDSLFRIDDYNSLFNLIMYCAYPYTFANGELFKPVYTVSDDNFIYSIDRGFNMIDEYLDYCEQFVYPMIRAYGRKGNIDLRDLNQYIIKDRRDQMRVDAVCAKLDRLQNTLNSLHQDNLKITNQLSNISGQLDDIYQAIPSYVVCEVYVNQRNY